MNNSVRTFLKAKGIGCAMWNLNIQGKKREVLSRRINKEQKIIKNCEQSQGEESKWLTQRHSTDHINQLEKVQRKDFTILIIKVEEVQKRL